MSNATRDKILRALTRWLWKIGSWVIRELARWTLREVVAYLRIRAGAYAERGRGLVREGKYVARGRWLQRRARRWRGVARWLEARWPDAQEALDAADARAREAAGIDEVPELVPLEVPGLAEVGGRFDRGESVDDLARALDVDVRAIERLLRSTTG